MTLNSEQILSNIADTLAVIKWNLILLNALLILVWIRIVVKSGLAMKDLVFRRETERQFAERMDKLTEDGDLDQAIAAAEQRLSEVRNSPYGYWYLCKIHFEKHEFEKVLEYGERLLDAAPFWEDEYIAPMLKKARERLAAQQAD